MTGSVDVAALAQELADAERSGAWVELFTARFDRFDRATARSIALERDRLRRAAGDEQLGYKLGFTSSTMRTALGVESPNWGTLWRSHLGDETIDLVGLHHPKIEPELVAEIGEDGVARWCLGLEIVNPRFASYRFDQLDNTADNSSCARVLLGTWVDVLDEPAAVEVEFTDGDVVVSGAGRNVDDGPAGAVRWLAGELAAEGTALVPGRLVFTGGLTQPFDVEPGRTYRLHSPSHPDLRPVELRTVPRA